MSLISLASNASVWRGYNYYNYKKVESYSKLNDSEYEASVKGSNNNLYKVTINLEHVRKSKCNCPHAAGTRIICKHMIALYFTIFPDEALNYIKKVEAEEREREIYEQQRYEEVAEYVNSLTVEQLKYELIRVLLDQDEEDYYDYY